MAQCEAELPIWKRTIILRLVDTLKKHNLNNYFWNRPIINKFLKSYDICYIFKSINKNHNRNEAHKKIQCNFSKYPGPRDPS